jgi:hypothetical protein
VYDKISAMDTTISWKQDALSTQTAYTSKWTSTKVPTITTNTLGQVTGITETNIAFPVTSVNSQTWAVTVSEVPSGWNNWDVLTNVSGTPTWAAPSGVTKSSIQVTLTTAGWSSKTQTVSATGVTASNDVIVSPAPTSLDDYYNWSVYCASQGSWTLTFKCWTVPTIDITVNVLILS